MAPIEILDNLFFIERGYLNGNHFVYRSKSPILIDTGYVADFGETAQWINGLGVDICNTSLIVNTHTHCDHIGGNQIIQQQSGCDIALHKVGKHFIDTQDDWATWWRYYHQEADFFNCTRALEDGEMIAAGPHEFQVIYTPGHASDGIVLYNRKEKLLISSDTLWEKDVATMTLRVEGSTALLDLKESLQKIEPLDIKRIYPGHGKPFGNFRQAVSKSKEKIRRYLQNREMLGNDLLKKIIVYTLLMKKMFDETEFYPFLMDTIWFRETIDLYFNGAYKAKYDEIMSGFLTRKVVKRKNGKLVTTVTP